MSVSYWGDLFYGIDRVEHSNLFDVNKEEKIILKELFDLFHTNEIKEMEEEYDINFENLSNLELLDYTEEITPFLIENIEAYGCNCSNQDVMFFGIPTVLPWEVKKFVTKEEIDRKIYESIKPILKDNVEYDDIKNLLKLHVINGADDYISFYSLDVK